VVEMNSNGTPVSEISEAQHARYIGLCFESLDTLEHKKHPSSLARMFYGCAILELNTTANQELKSPREQCSPPTIRMSALGCCLGAKSPLQRKVTPLTWLKRRSSDAARTA
jgi:hypothetical protein